MQALESGWGLGGAEAEAEVALGAPGPGRCYPLTCK